MGQNKQKKGVKEKTQETQMQTQKSQIDPKLENRMSALTETVYECK